MQARATVRRHESELGSWELHSGSPHPALAGAVHRYVGYLERSATPVRRREVPQDQVTVILNLGPPLTVGGGGLPAEGRGSFVAPLNSARDPEGNLWSFGTYGPS